MKKILSLFLSLMIFSSIGLTSVYAGGEGDDEGELIVNETFDAETTTWKNILSITNGGNNAITAYTNVNGNYLTLGSDYNTVATIDEYSDYIIEFDYRPDFSGVTGPQMQFIISGYDFFMTSMDTGIGPPLSYTSPNPYSKVGDYTFTHRAWTTIRVKKIANKMWCYVKDAGSEDAFTLVYTATFAENRTGQFKFNVWNTSANTRLAAMDNLKIWDISLSASVEDKLYDVNPGAITITFNNIIAQDIPNNVTISGGTLNNTFELTKISDKTVEVVIPNDILDYNTVYTVDISNVLSANGIATDNVTFKTVPKIIARIDGEQIARVGTEIIIELLADGSLPDGSSIIAEIPENIGISNGETVSCPARTETDKIIITLPQQLQFSTSYEVDLSAVQVVLNVNGTNYYSSLDNITFLTNNGEKELALDAVNNADTVDAMVTSLEAFNSFNDVSTRIDFFTDTYLTSVSGNAQKLAERKEALAQKLIGYREINGAFLKMDFSELIEGVEACVFELKMESYTKSDEALEDMFGIFTDSGFYDSNAKKTQSARLITELMNGTLCKTAEELAALEKKARSVMAVSIAENEAIVTIFDDTENYDFDKIVDLSNEDYLENKTNIAAKMTALRTTGFEYYTVESLNNDFCLATALTAFNVAETRVEVADAISKYGEALGLDLTGYNKFDSNLVCADLVNKSFNSASEIQSAINKRVSELSSSNTGTTQNRPGGGGGRGSVTVAPSTPLQSTVQSTPNINDTGDNGLIPFNDLDNVQWAKDAILKLYGEGKVSGVSEDRFEPERNVTRAEFSKLIAEVFGINSSSDLSYSDVNDEDWYYKYVSAVSEKGIATGNDNNEFMPDGFLTRQDMSVMIYRMILKLYSSSYVSKNGDVNSFEDASDISDYAIESVAKLHGNGIVNGVGNNSFAPLKNTTRAEAAVLLVRVRDILGGDVHE